MLNELLSFQSLSLNTVDISGITPLFLAVGYQELELAKILIKHGANPFIAAADGRTLLSAVVLNEMGDESGENPMLDMLLNLPNAERLFEPDIRGWTPVHLAAQSGLMTFLAEFSVKFPD